MNTKFINLFITFAFALANSTQVSAQVTIGSNLSPSSGALLELKTKTPDSPGGANADKGFMLPRVNLSSATDIENDITGVTIADKEMYAGLTIYNIGTFCHLEEEVYLPGVCIWDGERWQQLKDHKEGSSDGVYTYNDQEGKPYRARLFGPAGIWMVDNLAVKTFADGSSLPANPNTTPDRNNPQWCYPGPSPAPNPLPPGSTGAINGTDPYYYNNYREYGLLYNWKAATHQQNSFIGNQRKIAGDTPGLDEVESKHETSPRQKDGKIQGICPNGWHLPSDREWIELEKEMYENAEKYSYYSVEDKKNFSPQHWDPEWEKFISTAGSEHYSWRGGTDPVFNHSVAMRRPCILAYGVQATSGGKSYFPAKGGFNAIPAGAAWNNLTHFYGQQSSFWSSSCGGYSNANTSPKAIIRGFDFRAEGYPSMVNNGTPNIFDFILVRCKKDTNTP